MPRNRNRRRGGGGRGGGSDGGKASPDKPLFGGGVPGGVPAAARPVNITIYTRRGESEQMQCALYKTVRDLRDAARQRLGADLDQLMFGEFELEDGRTLASYGIQEGSIVSEPFQVTVQLPNLVSSWVGEKHDVTVSRSGSNTVDSLKLAVERTAAYRNSFGDFEFDDIFEGGLVFEGVQLKGDKLLCEYKIMEGSVVVAGGGGEKPPALVTPTNDSHQGVAGGIAGETSASPDNQRLQGDRPAAQAALPLADGNADKKFTVHVQFPDGEGGEVEAMGGQTVGRFRDTVERDYRKHVTKKMTFGEIVLEEDTQLSHYKIGEGSLVVFQMQIYLGFTGRPGLLLDVAPDTTIAEVKMMIEAKEQNLPLAEQRIFKNGENLGDEQTLQQHRVEDNANLFVIVRDSNVPPLQDGNMHLYIRYQGRIITLAISPMDTLAALKRTLERREDIPADQQRLSFAGEYKEDDSKALYECDIMGECLVDLVRRQGSSSGVHEQSAQGAPGSSFSLRFMRGPLDMVPIVMPKTTTLEEFFTEYSRRANAPMASLAFEHSIFETIPADCPMTPETLGIADNDVISVIQAGRPMSPAFDPYPADPYRTDDAVLDLTPFSPGSAGDHIHVTLKSERNVVTRAKINRNVTSLQLMFNEYADRSGEDPESLLYVCDARRLSHAAEETAAQYGIVDGDVIHSIVRREPPGQENDVPQNGMISMHVGEIGKPGTEKEFFRINMDAQLHRVLKQFATRKGVELDTLRFFYQGRILYADASDVITPLKLGLREGDTVLALAKKQKRPKTLTPDAIKTMKSFPQSTPRKDRGPSLFEPVLQVTRVNEAARELVLSDGEVGLAVGYHARLERSVDSGAIRKYSVIWACDVISVRNASRGTTRFTLLDAEEAAPNPGRALTAIMPLSFDVPAAPALTSQEETRLSAGLPYLTSCTTCCSADDEIKYCKRCKFMGYCSGACQTIGWKQRGHNIDCKYYQAYYDFVRNEFDGDNWDIADIFNFWSELKEQMGPNKPLDWAAAARICNTSLYSAFALLKNDFHTSIAAAFILNAGFLRQQCDTALDQMVEWYDIGSEGVALQRFLARVPHFGEAYIAVSSKADMMKYVRGKGACEESIVGSAVFEDQVKITFNAGGPANDCHYIGLAECLEECLEDYAYDLDAPFRELQFTLKRSDDSTLVLPKNTPIELGMKSRGEYTINVAAWGAEERRAQIVIAEFVRRQLRLRKVRKILARNIIADVVWRHHEDKARQAIADFIWHHHQQRKARKAIVNLLWRRIAFKRRKRLRDGATAIQRVSRGHATRNIHLEAVQRRLEEFRRFTAIWKRAIEQVPKTAPLGMNGELAGWALVRDRIDVRKVELLDEDGGLKDTDEKLNRALNQALNEEEEEVELEEVEADAEVEDSPEEQQRANEIDNLANIDWRHFQVTSHVVKFMKNGDAKYREFFVKKLRQLARGERSHKLQKPLKGCKSIIYETYLENRHGGYRILWTEEGGSIVVWFVAKHKSVSRYAELIDDAKNRTARQQLPQSFVSELESGGSEHQAPVKREILLDPIGNVPLKTYDVSFDSIDDLVDQSWTPQMHLTEEERKVVEAKGTILLLGRSGTGKTVCISNRIEYDRQRFAGRDDFTQLFLSRSSRLCRYVEGAVGKTDGSTFTTFDKHVRHLESLLKEEINGVYHPEKHVTFARFRQRFYTERYPNEDISALIVWRAIKTFLKGSIEAFKCPDGILPKEAFVVVETLGKNRCTIPVELRGPIYDIFLRYCQWIREENLWDDCDHIVALLKAIDDAKKNPDSLVYEEEIKKSKLYVDEVQDYTQIEILLFFFIGKGPGALFLAGDPAQSVVEGTDFRFEEVRSVGYNVAGERRDLIPKKPMIVNVNFRSHAGVLNCAGGFLDLLFQHFPGSAKQLEKDHGLFKGARPGVFRGVQVEQLSTLLKERLQGAVVLVHDESAELWKKRLGYPLVYGIREAKGLEFKSVIVLDFFGEIPAALQKPWRDLLSTTKDNYDFQSKHPLVESHLKLIYTAITRCIETLFFAETSTSTAGDAAVKWLTSTRTTGEEGSSDVLATQNALSDDLESMEMTADEFCVVGIDNAELAGSPDIELDQALSYLERAIYCFQTAQQSDLVAKAQTHRLSIVLREKLSKCTEVDDDCERDVANTATSLLKEGLLEECMNLLNSFAPFQSPYAQDKLDANVTASLRNALYE
ncbi:hypothetical protein ACHAXT_012120 [Thalassiosira profunda]